MTKEERITLHNILYSYSEWLKEEEYLNKDWWKDSPVGRYLKEIQRTEEQ